MMKAHENKQPSVDTQYDTITKEVEEAKLVGKATLIRQGTIYPEVATMLADDGNNVTIVKTELYVTSHVEISWAEAEAEKAGVVKVIEATPKIKKEENIEALILAGIVGGLF